MSSARNVKKVENSRRVGKARSGYNKGTIRGDLRYLVVSKDVRRHRLISISYISQWRCHCSGLDLTFPPTGLPDSKGRPHLISAFFIESRAPGRRTGTQLTVGLAYTPRRGA